MVVALLLTVQSVYAQKELRKIRLNVFRVDAATVAARSMAILLVKDWKSM
jgi:hypothetical protein